MATLLAALAAAPALGAFPYTRSGGSATDYKDFFLTTETPNDLTGKLEWMYAATPESGPPPDPFGVDLGGVRGGHVVDAADEPATAWETTLGRPDVPIAVLDSGIKWDDNGAMNNLRFKTWLNRGELPLPNNADGAAGLDGADCATYTGTGMGGYDIYNDNVFNLRDYACDDRVSINPPNNVNPGLFEPQDLLIAFSDGDDDDGNGFADDMVGWDFLDDDNDPYDDVQYGHGTGEAQDSTAEANNGGELGTCPNCMAMHMRVGDSFIADVNRFALATIYAVDNGAFVVQEALGTLNNTRLARQSVNYAYEHGVAVIASAADEAAQHNNWPSSLPHVILVNSVEKYDDATSPSPRSYLQFNGCTNFNAKITVAIPSVSCSSDATGRGSGMAGLVYSAALNAVERGKLDPHPTCTRAVDEDGTPGLDPCPISANEVRQLMASGTVGGEATSDDVDFLEPAEHTCAPVPAPGCTDPYPPSAIATLELTRAPFVNIIPQSRPYPARGGHDQFYGYGRVNMAKAVEALEPGGPGATADSTLPPEVEINSPEWYDQIDPDDATFEVRGDIRKRPGSGSCTFDVLVAPGHYPGSEGAANDFAEFVSDASCDTPKVNEVLATISIDGLEALFPPGTSFEGAQPPPAPGIDNGRPFKAPNGFVVKVVADTSFTDSTGTTALRGEDQRAMWLHRDADMLDGFPRKLMGSELTGDGASSPALADLDGDNRSELIVAGSDGFVHAFRRNGNELPGWPVRGDQPGFLHTGTRAFSQGVGDDLGGAILASVAVEDVDGDGIPEVFAADLEGKVYGWRAGGGVPFFQRQTNPDFSGKPLAAFQNVRRGKTNRTQRGIIGSPVLADIDGDPTEEIVVAAMDRHLYAWNPNGSVVDGFPALIVDPSKVESIDPTTHRVSFRSDSGAQMNGAIIVTPAIGDLDADANDTGEDELPEIVVGTNEEYLAGSDGGVNADTANGGVIDALEQGGVLDPGNSRLYVVNATGDPNPNPDPSGAFRGGWPVRIGLAFTELLPIVGEGMTGSPVIGPVACTTGGAGPKVGVIPNNGFGYILNPNGSSCYGQEGSNHRVLQTALPGGNPQKFDTPILPAVGHPAFGNLGGVGPSFLAPAAGVIRALDLAVNEYQGGQDFVMAWNAETSGAQPNFPGVVNDLQFLTGPSIADIDQVPATEEVVAGTASFDLAAFSVAGTAVPGWPKLTGDWTVANPVIGSFGTLDAGPGVEDDGKAVIGVTRSGNLLAYDTDAGACTPSSWPRFHHDNANSGDYERDAVLPAKPTDPTIPTETTMSFVAPGDDLLCATADHYEIVSSNSPIAESNFDSAPRELCGFGSPTPDCPDPATPGSSQNFTIPDGALRYVALRAVDDQDNVGRIALFDKGACVPDTVDDDCDGVENAPDNCPTDFNPGQADNDGDAQGDFCDPDDDNDGVGDDSDNCQFDANADQVDHDGDGVGNACDATPGTPPGGGGGAGGGGSGGQGAGPTAPCTNQIDGTDDSDRLEGTERSDRILGLRGRDRIEGLDGDDCLFGNKQRDRIDGGDGNDEIRGGNHRDRVIGGAGADFLHAGSGRDRVKARDGEADEIDCGKGEDKVKADDEDRTENCEVVKRK